MSLWKRAAIGLGALGTLGAGTLAIAVGYAAVTAESRLMYPDTPLVQLASSTDPEVIARGRYLVHGPAHCAACHSTDDRNDPAKVKSAPLDGGLPFDMGPIGGTWAPNLTPDVETGIGAWTDAELARVIRTGVRRNGELSIFMSLSIGHFSDEDVVAMISYLRSLEPLHHEVPPGRWTLLGKVLLTYAFPVLEPRDDAAPAHVAADDEPSVAQGAYLARVAACLNCHTAMDQATFEHIGPPGGGGLPEPSHGDDANMEFVAPNLTSHPTGITGRLDEDAFVARMHGGRAYTSSIMPWECFEATTETDLRSIYRYLRTLPPVDNDTGPPYREIGWSPG